MYRGRGGKGGGRGGGGYGGKGRGGGKGGGGKGGGGKGGKGGGGYNWRQHVEPSTDPEIVNPCRERVAAFLARLTLTFRLHAVEDGVLVGFRQIGALDADIDDLDTEITGLLVHLLGDAFGLLGREAPGL